MSHSSESSSDTSADPKSNPKSNPKSDPRPEPPDEIYFSDCCGSGCTPCVLELYEIEKTRYAEALAAWLARHPGADDES